MRAFGIILAILLAAGVFGCKTTSGGGGGGGDTDSSGGTVEEAENACGGPTQGCVIGNVIDADTEGVVSDVVISVGGEVVLTSLSKATGTEVATSNAQGWFFLTGIEAAEAVTLCFQHADYVTLCRNYEVIAQSTVDLPPILLTARAISQDVDADAGGTITNATTGAELTINGGSVCAEDGVTPVTGEISCSLTAIPGVDAMPGYSDGIRIGSQETALMAGGVMEISCEDGEGNPLELCTAQTAQARIPIWGYTECGELDATVQSWRFDEESGLWDEYDTVAKNCGGAENTSYYSGLIDSFTWWASAWTNNYTCMQGAVVDTVTEDPNSQAVVECDTATAQGKTERARFGTLSESDGSFCLRAAVSTYYTCRARKASFTSNDQVGDVPVNTLECPHIACWDVGTFSLESPILRTTLTWLGESTEVPSDLDSYFMNQDSTIIVYYSDKGDLTAAPYIELDTDSVSWSGPENTTVVPSAYPDTYRFCVHKFSDDGDLTTSGAQVVVSGDSGGLPRLYTIPTSPAGRLVWKVYDVVIGEDGSLEVTDINELAGDLDDDEIAVCME